MELTEFEFERLLKNSLAAEDVPSELLNARLKEKLNAKRPEKNIFVPMKTVAAAVLVIAVSAGVIVNSNEGVVKPLGESQVAYIIKGSNSSDVVDTKPKTRDIKSNPEHKTDNNPIYTQDTKTDNQVSNTENTDINFSEYITQPNTEIQLASEPMTRSIEAPIDENVSYDEQIGIAAFTHTDGEIEGTDALATADDWGIELSAKDVSREGLTIVYTHKDTNFAGELSINSDYIIEEYFENEIIPVETVNDVDSVENTDEQNVILQIGTVETEINWKDLYGSLDIGKYRLGKEITNTHDSGECEISTYYVDFEIE